MRCWSANETPSTGLKTYVVQNVIAETKAALGRLQGTKWDKVTTLCLPCHKERWPEARLVAGNEWWFRFVWSFCQDGRSPNRGAASVCPLRPATASFPRRGAWMSTFQCDARWHYAADSGMAGPKACTQEAQNKAPALAHNVVVCACIRGGLDQWCFWSASKKDKRDKKWFQNANRCKRM